MDKIHQLLACHTIPEEDEIKLKFIIKKLTYIYKTKTLGELFTRFHHMQQQENHHHHIGQADEIKQITNQA